MINDHLDHWADIEIESSIATCRDTERRLENELFALRQKREVFVGVLLARRFGAMIGRRVRAKGKLYQISEVRTDGDGRRKPWVKGRRLRKDGTLTDREYELYSEWEVDQQPVKE